MTRLVPSGATPRLGLAGMAVALAALAVALAVATSGGSQSPDASADAAARSSEQFGANSAAYMLVDSIAGDSRDADHADWADVISFSIGGSYPFNMREGEGRGEPQLTSLTVRKPLDRMSPLLYEKMAKKQQIASVKIEQWRANPTDGSSESAYMIELQNVRVVGYRVTGGEGGTLPGQGPEEVVQFAFQIIDITWLSGGQIPITYDFSNPNS